MRHTVILFPFYHDEVSLNMLLAEIESNANSNDRNLSLLIVNDGTPQMKITTKLPCITVHLHRNIGHQKAIAIGMAYAHHHLSFDQLVIMDSDGEDKPAYISDLCRKSEAEERIVVAQRSHRHDGKRFLFFYSLYKFMFNVLTGKKISFGNFMALPKKDLDRLIYFSEIWNHLAGTIIKSKLPYSSLAADKGKRYEGRSKMNFTSLVLHGLGAIGVFIEVVASRLFLFSLLLIAISILAIAAIIFIRLFTERAIPGWATTAFSAMLIVLLQSFLFSLFTLFLFLTLKTQRQFIPALHYNDYIRSVENSEK